LPNNLVLYDTPQPCPEAPELFIELGFRPVGPPTNDKPGVRLDVYDTLLADCDEDIHRYSVPHITHSGTLDRFFMQPIATTFTGDVAVLAAAFECVKILLKPLFTKARALGKSTYKEVQEELNQDAAPGVVIKDKCKVSSKGEALSSPAAREYMVDFIRRKDPAIFTVRPKFETLEASKCPTGEVRTFEIAPLEYLLSIGRHTKPFIQALLDGHPLSAYGITLQHGGFARVMDEMEPDKPDEVVFAGDVSKWDKNNSSVLMYLGYMLLEDLWPDDVDWLLDLNYIIQNELFSIMLLPDGRLIQKVCGTIFNSGTDATTAINILKHMLIYVYHLIFWKSKMFSYTNLLDVPLTVWLSGERFKCYADDHLGKGLAGIHTLARRSVSYSHFGMTLKPEDDFVSRSTEGVTFLGFVNRGGVPTFDKYKILTGLWLTKRKADAQADISQIYAMLMLASTNEELYHGFKFCDFVWNIVNRYLQTHYSRDQLIHILGSDTFHGKDLIGVAQIRQIWTHRYPTYRSTPERLYF